MLATEPELQDNKKNKRGSNTCEVLIVLALQVDKKKGVTIPWAKNLTGAYTDCIKKAWVHAKVLAGWYGSPDGIWSLFLP